MPQAALSAIPPLTVRRDTMARAPTPKTDRLREMREERYAGDQKRKESREELKKTTDEDAHKAPKPKLK
jgi:hypothetical protein